jgi:hypothetical protein
MLYVPSILIFYHSGKSKQGNKHCRRAVVLPANPFKRHNRGTQGKHQKPYAFIANSHIPSSDA